MRFVCGCFDSDLGRYARTRRKLKSLVEQLRTSPRERQNFQQELHRESLQAQHEHNCTVAQFEHPAWKCGSPRTDTGASCPEVLLALQKLFKNSWETPYSAHSAYAGENEKVGSNPGSALSRTQFWQIDFAEISDGWLPCASLVFFVGAAGAARYNSRCNCKFQHCHVQISSICWPRCSITRCKDLTMPQWNVDVPVVQVSARGGSVLEQSFSSSSASSH